VFMKISIPKITVVLALLAISTIIILQTILHHGAEKRYPRRHSGGDGTPLSPLLRGNQPGEPGWLRRKGHEDDSAMDGNTSGSALADEKSTGLLAQGMVSGQASGASTAASAAREKYAGVWAGNMRLMKQRHEQNGSASCPRGSDQNLTVTVVDLDRPRGGTFNETM
jgi:hypothetical protein